MFLNVIIKQNKEQHRQLISTEESENVFLSLQSLCACEEKDKKIQIYSIACIIPLCICESEGGGWGEERQFLCALEAARS